jgi:hypothetical protein
LTATDSLRIGLNGLLIAGFCPFHLLSDLETTQDFFLNCSCNDDSCCCNNDYKNDVYVQKNNENKKNDKDIGKNIMKNNSGDNVNINKKIEDCFEWVIIKKPNLLKISKKNEKKNKTIKKKFETNYGDLKNSLKLNGFFEKKIVFEVAFESKKVLNEWMDVIMDQLNFLNDDFSET